jgi:hypothetical protein
VPNIAGKSCGWAPVEDSKATYTHATDNWMSWMCKYLAADPNHNDAKKIINALAIGLEIGDETAAEKLAAAQSFCAYYNNKDIITNTKVTPLEGGVDEVIQSLPLPPPLPLPLPPPLPLPSPLPPPPHQSPLPPSSTLQINTKLFGDWGGKVIPDVSPTMMSADYSAFHFYQADVAAGKYDYRMWVNYTALGGQEFQGGWPNFLEEEPYSYLVAQSSQMTGLMGRMNNAIINSIDATKDIKIQTDTKNMPTFFKETMLQIFGGFSLGDFIARELMPYIMLLYLFVIQGMVPIQCVFTFHG